jgi:6-phosphogluconolactonase
MPCIPQHFEFIDARSMSAALADAIEQEAKSALLRRGVFTLCLAGGSSPRQAYEMLAGKDLPWRDIHLFFGDERLVFPCHGWSNFRMARKALIDRIEIPSANVRRMRGEMNSAAAAARDYERRLRAFFGPGASLPEFDVCLLGLGPDGHTASLFPGHAVLEETEAWVVGVEEPTLPPAVRRISLSLPALNASKKIFFATSDCGKQPLVETILTNRTAVTRRYPAARVQARDVVWFTTQQL